MSSAILYVAIVAIWACVLIPRWLRRDSSASANDVAGQAEDEAVVNPVAEEPPAPLPVPAPVPVAAPALRPASRSGPAARPGPPARPRPEEAPRLRRDEAARHSPVAAEDRDPAHRRVVSARRRLLMMLIALSLASGVLAGTRMAAWWVVVPPSVMLLGYVLLLREAAKADAERREMARYRAARPAAPAPVRGRAPSVAPAEAAEAKVFTIPTAPEPAEEELYDQYADAKLRAVGD